MGDRPLLIYTINFIHEYLKEKINSGLSPILP